MEKISDNNRRLFLKQSLVLAGTGIILPAIASCNKEGEEDVSPAEDLMREHGVLNRILLIYDHCSLRIQNEEEVPFNAIQSSADIIRKFIENYHEKLEEDHLFPRFEKANQLTDLVAVLRQQHKAGRLLTDQIFAFAKDSQRTKENNGKLIASLRSFNSMYRPHEAREDTVLFPTLRKIISSHEYDSLGEDFEKKEHELFGEDGFESM